jgi:type IX secretion system PorP/SprF family membrane protein
MWNQNHYLVNPAAAGNQDYFEASMGYRRQWAGIKEAPKSFYATGHTILNRPKTHQLSALRISQTKRSKFYNTRKNLKPYFKHALGGQLRTNEFGAFEKTEVTLTYAAHIPINRDMYLSLGLSGGLHNYGFDQSKARVLFDNDPTYDAYAAGENSNQLNINSGAYLYAEKFFVGYSALHLLQNDLAIADIQTNTEEASLSIQHFIIGGYNFQLNNDFKLTPTVLYKIAEATSQFEFGGTLTYREEIFGGINFRNEDAISVMLGMQVNHLLRLGYSYDYTTSDLAEQSSGSHEIFIGLTLF